MMKHLLFQFVMLFIFSYGYAQTGTFSTVNSPNSDLLLKYKGATKLAIGSSEAIFSNKGKFNNGIWVNSGTVGIGTHNPSGKFHVIGESYFDGWLRVNTTGKGLYFQKHGGGLYMADNTWIRTYGNKSFYHNTGVMRTDGTFQVGPGGNRFLVATDGKVGLGTTAPAGKLHVNGDTYINGWLRANVSGKGLYFQKHGGGFYMSDNTWIRTYGSKHFYTGQGVVRSDKGLQVGSSGEFFNASSSGVVAKHYATKPNESGKPANGYRLWHSDKNWYGMYMGNDANFQLGYVTDYSIKFSMQEGGASGYRGWTWGQDGQKPVASLDTRGHFFTNGAIRSTAANGSDFVYLRNVVTSGDTGYSEIRWGDNTNDPFRFFFHSYNNQGSKEVMRLLPSGNVGIGTSTPKEKLDVNGNAIVSGTIYAGRIDVDSGGANSQLQDSSLKSVTGTTASSQSGACPEKFEVFVKGVEKLRVGCSETLVKENLSVHGQYLTLPFNTKVTIGGNPTDNPDHKLYVKGDTKILGDLSIVPLNGEPAVFNADQITVGDGISSDNRAHHLNFQSNNHSSNSTLVKYNLHHIFQIKGSTERWRDEAFKFVLKDNAGNNRVEPFSINRTGVTVDGALESTGEIRTEADEGFRITGKGAFEKNTSTEIDNNGNEILVNGSRIFGVSDFVVEAVGDSKSDLKLRASGAIKTESPMYFGNSAYFKASSTLLAPIQVEKGIDVVPVGDIALPDYVFAQDYDLNSIEELEKFVKENKHLPGVISEAQLKKEGKLELLSFTYSLLEKIEELALYTIDQENQIESQDAELQALKIQQEKILKTLESLSSNN